MIRMNGMNPHTSLIYKVDGKFYLVFNFGSGKQAHLELQEGKPQALIDAMKAERKAEEKRMEQIEKDREYQRQLKQEIEKSKGQVGKAINEAYQDVIEKAKKRVSNRLGYDSHSTPKVPPVEDVMESED